MTELLDDEADHVDPSLVRRIQLHYHRSDTAPIYHVGDGVDGRGLPSAGRAVEHQVREFALGGDVGEMVGRYFSNRGENRPFIKPQELSVILCGP